MPEAVISIGDLECEVTFDYSPEQGDGWHEPRYSAEAEVTDIRVEGISIVEIWDALDRKERDRIEAKCVEAAESQAAGIKADIRIDAYLERVGR